MSSNNKKESFSFVPQEISRHFIEPGDEQVEQQQHTNVVGICIKETAFDITIDEEEEEEEEEEHVDDQVIYDNNRPIEEENDDSTTLYDSDYSDSEGEEGEEECQPPKWSFVRGLFSKFHIGGNSPQPSQQYDHSTSSSTPSLSTYGTLQNKRIGEGVSAMVQLIQRGDETYAVKIFRKKKRRESLAGYMKALAGEFCISSALNHPNIIKTLDFVRMDDDHARYCIVMEYCPEGDMYALIKQGRIEDAQMYSYFKQLLLGLNYLHSLGVAHRDLKPENLLISKGTLRIADFGSADVFRVAWQDHSRLSDGLCGTTPYMAPEIFLDQGYWAAPVDVWAAGIIFFCMRFDGVPFGSAQRTDANYPIYLRKRPLRQYDPFNKLALEPRTLIYAMLSPDPDRRVTVHEILNVPWIQSIQT